MMIRIHIEFTYSDSNNRKHLFIQHGFVINMGEPNETSSLDHIHHSKLKVSIFSPKRKMIMQ